MMFARSCLLSFHSPNNFLRSSKSNRFAIAATFGATASTCLALVLVPNHFKFFREDSSSWLKGKLYLTSSNLIIIYRKYIVSYDVVA